MDAIYLAQKFSKPLVSPILTCQVKLLLMCRSTELGELGSSQAGCGLCLYSGRQARLEHLVSIAVIRRQEELASYTQL